MEVKALACELPYHHGIPLSRFSIEGIRREVITRGIAAQISVSTLWRWLNEDAIRPWLYRSWIFPRDPAFEEKAARILDLYEGFWNGLPLGHWDKKIMSCLPMKKPVFKLESVNMAPYAHYPSNQQKWNMNIKEEALLPI